MLREGHLGIALLMYAPFAFVFILLGWFEIGILGLVFTLFGVGLPDGDTKLRIVKHRGFTHTIWFAFLVSFASMGFIATVPEVFGITTFATIGVTEIVIGGLFAGYGVISHLVGDLITPHGIRPLHPVFPREKINYEVSDRKFSWELTKAKSDKANTLFLVVGSLSMVLATVGGAVLLF